MPRAVDYATSPLVKMLLIGDSGTGKTGALVSLLEAGYKVVVLDFDKGLDYLIKHLQRKSPALLQNLYYQTYRDKLKLMGGEMLVQGVPKALSTALKDLDNGIDDLGPLGKLGPDWVVVLDSLSLAGQAAFRYHKMLSPSNDPRQNYFGAQQIIMGLINNLTADEFQTHAIVMTHINFVELEQGVMKGLPSAIGKAISSELPKSFNTMLEMKVSGVGEKANRVISTVPSITVPAKAALPAGAVKPALDISTGLAEFFKAFTGRTPEKPKAA